MRIEAPATWSFGWARLPLPIRLLIAIVLIQALFWLALKPLLFSSNDSDFPTYSAQNIAEAAISTPTYAAMSAAAFDPVQSFPAWHCCERGYRALRYTIVLDRVPESGLGIRPRVNADNLGLYVNGRFVAGKGRMALPYITYNALLRQIYPIPPAALRPGANEIAVVMVRDANPYFDYYEPVIGEYAIMHREQAWRMFFLGGYKYVTLGMIGLALVFALIVLARAERRREAFWFVMVAGGWLLLSLYYLLPDPPIRGLARLGFYFCVSLSIPLAWFGLADAWARQKITWAAPLAIGLYVLTCAGVLFALYTFQPGENFDWAGQLHDLAAIIFAVMTVLRIGHAFVGRSEDRIWEAAILVLLATLIALNALGEWVSATTTGYLSHTQPFLILGLAVAFLARNVRLFRSSAQINTMLAAQLEERAAALEAAHQRERTLVQRQAHEAERQRIMRDMHDGLGSQLMSMLVMARRGKAQATDFEHGLEQVIDEMRLMIDSMDSVGESLGVALTAFDRRMSDRVRAAGFTYIWQQDANRQLPALDPRQVLQVFRIMQEAVANALKHSGGGTIAITIGRAGDRRDVTRIEIADDGPEGDKLASDLGDDGPRRGRGLDNMRHRAAGIGGQLQVLGDGSGTRVVLDLPEAPPARSSRDLPDE